MIIGDYVSTPAVITAGVLLAGVSVLGIPAALMAGRRAGRRMAHPQLLAGRRERIKDTALFLAAMIPSILVWLAVMSVSFIGLTGFARDVMSWDHWTNMLVPLSLDGISVSFGAWAFVAVKRGRHPGRAYKIVMAAAAMSAVLNFVHGQSQYSIWAGLYLGFLSFAGMAMFHELLDQFMAQLDEEELIRRGSKPRFGERWLWAPVSTLSARRAWIVHPVPVAVRPTIANALHHLGRVPTITGKTRKMKTVVYTKDQLLLFPDGLSPSSRETLPGFPGDPSRETPLAHGKNGHHVPPQVNGAGKTVNGSRIIFPPFSPPSTREIVPAAPGRLSPEDVERQQIAHLVDLLTRGESLTTEAVRAMFRMRQPAAKALLLKAKAQLTIGNFLG
jgi:hypothetical protein